MLNPSLTVVDKLHSQRNNFFIHFTKIFYAETAIDKIVKKLINKIFTSFLEISVRPNNNFSKEHVTTDEEKLTGKIYSHNAWPHNPWSQNHGTLFLCFASRSVLISYSDLFYSKNSEYKTGSFVFSLKNENMETRLESF